MNIKMWKNGLFALLGSTALTGVSAQETTAPDASAAPVQQALAPDTPSPQTDGDIVVTALKREQRLQDVPASLTVLSSDLLERIGASDFSKVADSVPGVSYATTGVGNSQFIIRGIGSVGVTQSPLTGVYLDETSLQSRAVRGFSQPDPQLYDIARVEVLRGPQGVLFGSSSMGGLVRIITNQPNTAAYEGSVEGSVASVKDGSANGDIKSMLNVPIVRGTLALRVVASYIHQGGWIDDLRPTTADVTENLAHPDRIKTDVNWTEFKTVRASLKWTPSPTLTITPSLTYQDGYSNTDRQFSDITFGLRAREKARYLQTYTKDHFVIGNLLVKKDVDVLGGLSILSSSAYVDRNANLLADVTAFLSPAVEDLVGPAPGNKLYPVALQDFDHTKQFTQEVRLVSSGTTPLQYVVGGFYRHLDQDFQRGVTAQDLFGAAAPAPFGASRPPALYDVLTHFTESEIAGFGEVTYAFAAHLKAAAGVRVFRYSQSEADARYGLGGVAGGALDYAYAASNGESGATPRFTLSYEPSRAATFYVSYSQGYRTGGVNAPITNDVCTVAERRAQGLPDDPAPYRSDKTDNFEVGAKTQFLNGRLRANASLFTIDWKDFQQAFQTTCGANNENTVSFVVNAGKVRSRGGELEIMATPLRGLNLIASGSYTDATYRNDVPQLALPAGSRVLDVPRVTWTMRADYSLPISKRLVSNLLFSAHHVGDADSGFGEGEVLNRPAYTLIDLTAGVTTPDALRIEFFVNNVTDAIPVYGAEFGTAPGTTTQTSYFSYHVGPPRTIGVRVSKGF